MKCQVQRHAISNPPTPTLFTASASSSGYLEKEMPVNPQIDVSQKYCDASYDSEMDWPARRKVTQS